VNVTDDQKYRRAQEADQPDQPLCANPLSDCERRYGGGQAEHVILPARVWWGQAGRAAVVLGLALLGRALQGSTRITLDHWIQDLVDLGQQILLELDASRSHIVVDLLGP
jgi:hypothetical protein